MNERIRQLAEQAGVFAGDFAGAGLYSIHNKDEVEEFANLIVAECAKSIRKDLKLFPADDLIWRCAMEESARVVEKHFGVEP